MPSIRRPIAIFALALLSCPGAALAQAVVQPLPGTTDADQLAAIMRRVAADPRDTTALVTAGELSLKLGDSAGAASLFARADRIDPRNPRARAGMATLLIRAERPGEALRYFAMAESFGAEPRRIAPERGLAYDLIGEQERAQRDYRLALRQQPDDETVRRYALSLGISGKRDQALEQLEPLVRRSDRAAWRARAFILAMSGDAKEASRIASTMFPSGMAAGLGGFFQRLPQLSAVDRAFAVHFGEIVPTPQRLADARLTPALPTLGAEPGVAVMLAAATPAPAAVEQVRDTRRDRHGRRTRERQGRDVAPVALAAAVGRVPLAAPIPTPAAVVLPVAPVALARADASPITPSSAFARATAGQPRPTERLASTPSGRGLTPAASFARAVAAPLPYRPSSTVASAPAGSQVRPGFSPAVTTAAMASSQPVRPAATGSIAVAVAPSTSLAAAQRPIASSASLVVPAATSIATATSTTLPPAVTAINPSLAAAPPSQGALAPSPMVPAASAATIAAVAPGSVVPSPAPVGSAVPPVATPLRQAALVATADRLVADAAPLAAPRAAASPPGPSAAGDSILARIVANISVPAAELGIQAPVRAVSAPATTPFRTVSERQLTADRQALAASLASAQGSVAPQGTSPTRARPDPQERPAERGTRSAAERRTVKGSADAKTARESADVKAGRDGKAAETKAKLAAKKLEKPAKADEPRIWVQVAGGANEGDLAKAWSTTRSKASALKGRQGWSTPLRATNRVLTGPFKTDAEARSFVNQLAKQGVSAFAFTSVAGQKVTKLGAR